MIRRLFASFFLLLFFLLSFPFNLVISIYITFSNENFYKQNFVDFIYDIGLREIPNKIDLTDYPSITQDDFKNLLKNVIKKEDLISIVDALIQQFKSNEFIKDDGTMQLTIPFNVLTDKKDLIASEISNFLVKKLPVCEKLRDFSYDDLKCLPKDIAREDLATNIKSFLEAEGFNNIPEKYVANLGKFDIIDKSKNIFDLAVNIFIIYGLILLCLLAIIGLIIFKPWYRVLKWEAKSIFFSSFWTIVTIFILSRISAFFALNVDQIIVDIYNFIIESLSHNIYIYFGPIAALSLILWIIFIVVDYKKSSLKKKNDTQ